MSVIATQAHYILDKLFPANPHKRIFLEQYIKYKGAKLFFDFYIKELGVYVEVQGRQHTQFVKHFHGTKEKFLAQKFRDNLKIQYIQEKDKYLIRLYGDEKISENLVLVKINKAFDSEHNFYE